MTSSFVFGEQNNNQNGVNKDEPVLHSFPYTAGSVTPLTDIQAITTPLSSHPAVAQQIGAVWGLAWNPQNHILYGAAFMKGHVGFGPNGPGANYQIPAGGTPSLFHDFGAVAGVDPHPKSTDSCTSSGRIDSNFNCWFNDSNSFDQVGKIGFGDLDISDDFKTLYTVESGDQCLNGDSDCQPRRGCVNSRADANRAKRLSGHGSAPFWAGRQRRGGLSGYGLFG